MLAAPRAAVFLLRESGRASPRSAPFAAPHVLARMRRQARRCHSAPWPTPLLGRKLGIGSGVDRAGPQQAPRTPLPRCLGTKATQAAARLADRSGRSECRTSRPSPRRRWNRPAHSPEGQPAFGARAKAGSCGLLERIEPPNHVEALLIRSVELAGKDRSEERREGKEGR